jgi:hypothetical protein
LLVVMRFSSMVFAAVSSVVVHLVVIALVMAWPHNLVVSAPLDDRAVLLSVVGDPDVPAPEAAPRPSTPPSLQTPAAPQAVARKARKAPVALTARARRPLASLDYTEEPREPAPAPVKVAIAPVPAPVPATQPVRLAPDTAKELRVYDVFPSAPASVRSLGGTAILLVEICVSAQGAVSGTRFSVGSGGPLADNMRAAIATWRYRPLVVGGAPRPFCHDVKIEYRSGAI